MKYSTKISLGIFSIASVFFLMALTKPAQNKSSVTVKPQKQKIQAAILLDVSSSMEGLIEQAKAQLWNMVSVMGKAQCDNNTTPEIEIALYEYGRSSNDPKAGYIKQLSGFTTDLDQLSKNLFSLTTNGGDEYCGQVIYTSLNQLNWDASAGNYKVIFIAGNEDFLQGTVTYSKACESAKEKGVIVNTIYCGDRQQGIREHWNLNTECGNGSFTNIDQNAKIEEIPTPYDSTLISLNGGLNNTYLSYGYSGADKFKGQAEMDQANASMSKSVGLQRIAVKGKKDLYRNESWDMVDASASDSLYYAKVDMKTLPDSLKNKTRAQLKEVIQTKMKERSLIQKNIETLNTQREAYITAERKRRANNSNSPTLETEVEKTIRLQAKRFNMVIQ
ncbi:MAG: vWA domain-containing protein [Ferruginibacter sp.]